MILDDFSCVQNKKSERKKNETVKKSGGKVYSFFFLELIGGNSAQRRWMGVSVICGPSLGNYQHKMWTNNTEKVSVHKKTVVAWGMIASAPLPPPRQSESGAE